jgi:glycosyltransferase involved in cell wall biosynthesis
MRILIFNWQCIKNPKGGGAEVHMHEIFKRIAAMGHEVTLFCSMFEGADKEEVIDGIKIIRQGSRSLFNFYVPHRYKKQFRFENYDLVIDDINKIPFYTPLYIRNKPLLAISHHFFGKSIFREAGIISGSYVYISEKLVDYVYTKTPFVVVSQSTLDEFLARGFDRENFFIVQNAITQSDYPMKVLNKDDHPSIAYFGRMKKYKCVDHLLQAFALVLKDHPTSQLNMLGTGDFLPYLKNIAKDLNIDNNTQFFGYVTDEQKVYMLSKSWAAVNTSQKEGWGITNIEANACGTPVISADVPGLRDSVSTGQSGLLYEHGNIRELADILIKLIKNKEKREYLSEGAVKWAKSFSWDKSAEDMLWVCERVVSINK